MKIAKKSVLLTLCIFLCLLFAFYLYSAVLTGGNFIIPAISISSGGGVPATGGNLSMSAVNVGQNIAGTNLSGGNFTVAGGIVPTIVVTETAKKDLSLAHCYPVPFKPSLGHTKITFKDLTRDAEIKIYTISGEIIRTIKKSDGNDYIEWDVKNSRGENLASGVYLFLIKNIIGAKKGKLMIIK
ncbi:MAG: hypothetical protein HY746_01480 [Elusimicrobia bacterium]|nr:hypothetical protein [Elusimicrobiota bacterium]